MSALFKTPLGYEQITDLSSAAALSPPAGAALALIVVEGQAVRWRDDGTSPTAGVGMTLAVGTLLEYGGSLSAIEFIEQAAGAKLNASYY